jgi:hypothetical protein
MTTIESEKDLQKLRIDYLKVHDLLYGNWEIVHDQAHQIYGHDVDILEQHPKAERDQILKEKLIFTDRALEFLFKLDLMNVGSIATVQHGGDGL